MRASLFALLIVGLSCPTLPAAAAGQWSARGLRPDVARHLVRPQVAPLPLSFDQAKRIVFAARRRLGVNFRLKWESASRRIEHIKGKPIKVTRGVAQQKGLTADGLALMLAHEAAHARGIRSEAKADYWAARHGLRKLWGKRSLTKADRKRALEASCALLAATHEEHFDPRPVKRATIELHATGYPTLQSRWDLAVAGIFGRPMPRVAHRTPESEPKFLDRAQAALFLGVSEAWLAKRVGKDSGPMTLNLGDGEPVYVQSNLAQFKEKQTQP